MVPFDKFNVYLTKFNTNKFHQDLEGESAHEYGKFFENIKYQITSPYLKHDLELFKHNREDMAPMIVKFHLPIPHTKFFTFFYLICLAQVAKQILEA